MKNLSSWLIAMFAFMFWGFRVAAMVMYSLGISFPIQPIDITMETILLFITFICICFIVKRKLLAALIYLAGHGVYYGIALYQSLIASGGQIKLDYINMFVALLGLILPIMALFDVLLDKSRKAHPVDKQTDWFYKNKEFDRKLDERADKNNYKTL